MRAIIYSPERTVVKCFLALLGTLQPATRAQIAPKYSVRGSPHGNGESCASIMSMYHLIGCTNRLDHNPITSGWSLEMEVQKDETMTTVTSSKP